MKGELTVTAFASDEVKEALSAVNVFELPRTPLLFANPKSFLLIDVKSPEDNEGASQDARRLFEACLQDGVRYGACFGFPAGPSWVGMAIGLAEEVQEPERLLEEYGGELRQAAMLMHSCAYSYGALAATFDLTIRERDALCTLAKGLNRSEGAAQLRVSERVFGDFLRSARGKLRAATNSEALAKAIALNALVLR